MKKAAIGLCLGLMMVLAAVPAGAQDWVTPFQDSGSWAPFPIPEDGDMALGQTFEVTQGLAAVGIASPTWEGTGAGYRFRVFAWTGDYAGSVAGTAIVDHTEVDHADNAWTDVVLDTVAAPGAYLIVTDEPVRGTGNVGHWGWNGSDAAGGAVPGAYSNGSLMDGVEFQIRYAEGEYTGGEGEGEGEGEPQEVVFNFDCGREGWYPNGTSTLTDHVGAVSYMATGGDPFMVVDVPVDGTALGEVAFQVNVAGSPSDSFTSAFFWFADGGHGRVPYTLTGDGDYTVRLNPGTQQESGTGAWDASVYRMRLDFPDGGDTDFVNAGTVFTLDWFAVTADAEYVGMGNEAAADCDGDGLSSGFEAALGTNPLVADSDSDGVDDGIEVQYGTDPLNADETPTVPAVNGFGLAAAALAMALAGLMLVRRRTA